MTNATHTNERQCIGIVGRQRTGKSALVHEIIRSYKKRGGKVRVYSPHPDQFGNDGILCNRNNINDVIGQEPVDKKDKGHGLLSGEFQGMVVFDDCDTYFGPKSTDNVTTFLSTFRHYNCDVIVVSRALQGIDIAARRCFTRLCAFMMHEPRAIKMLEELLGEFTEKGTIEIEIPDEPFRYFSYDLETYEVEEHQTTKIKAV